MSVRSLIRFIILSVAILSLTPAFAAEDATVHQVYLAAQAGKFDEAQAMMDKVLLEHPNSGKAHFVEAELLAKLDRIAEAQTELATAERLAPGLPFAKPLAVQHLRAHLAAPAAAARSPAPPYAAPAPAASSMPWGWLLAGAGLIAFIIFAVRFMGQRATPTYAPAGMGNNVNNGFGSSAGAGPYAGAGPGAAPMAGAPSGGGIGSGIMGGLATGAAMGAGIVAGEALMHHFTDGNRSNPVNNQPAPVDTEPSTPAPDDMGGTDFGVADNSSWDDGGGGGGGGGDDWN